jgi:hypothetical protein
MNKHAELYPLDKEAEYPCIWQLICRQELYAYFRVPTYIGITIKPAIKDYWKDLNIHSSLIFLSTSTKFSQSNWLILIDNLRTRIDVLRDTKVLI